MSEQLRWRSTFSFVIVTAMAVIGLGNLWLFPSLVHQYGASFVLFYFVALVLVGIPAMMAEMAIGRQARCNPVDAFRFLAFESGHSTKWRFLGWFGVLTLLLVLSFYGVMSSFSLGYISQLLTGSLHGTPVASLSSDWQNFLSRPLELLFWNTVVVVLTVVFIARGLRRGLELISFVTIFGLFILLFYLVYQSYLSPNFHHAVSNLFSFNQYSFSWGAALAGLSYAFFSLSIGAGAMLVYGSYLPIKSSLTRSVFFIVMLDVLASVLAFLAIYPFVYSTLSANSSGLGLLFEELPAGLVKLAHFRFDATLFYLAIFLVAWTSVIAFFEPIAYTLIQKLEISRLKAAIISGFVVWLLGIGSILSFNIWHQYHWNYLYLISHLTTEIMLPIGALGISIFAGWLMPKHRMGLELNAQRYRVIFLLWRFMIRYVTPVGIIVVLLMNFA